MRKDCPMRGNLGNCSPVGGFCIDAVSDEICEAVHNAYDHGFFNAVKTLKEQKSRKGHWIEDETETYTENHDTWECSECHEPFTLIEGTPEENKFYFCPRCGADMR